MENASDALVMAGTILISLVIISALVLMFNGIINYQKTASIVEEEEQKTNLNKEYTAFEKDLYGSEILSLINKAVDYNEKNKVDGYEPIKIVITVKKDTGSGRTSLVTAGTYEISEKESNILSTNLLSEIETIKTKYKGDKYLQRLVALYNSNNEEELNRVLQEINGAYRCNDNTKKEIIKYSEYMEFKRKKFKFDETVYHGESNDDEISSINGRILKMCYTEYSN